MQIWFWQILLKGVCDSLKNEGQFTKVVTNTLLIISECNDKHHQHKRNPCHQTRWIWKIFKFRAEIEFSQENFLVLRIEKIIFNRFQKQVSQTDELSLDSICVNWTRSVALNQKNNLFFTNSTECSKIQLFLKIAYTRLRRMHIPCIDFCATV